MIFQWFTKRRRRKLIAEPFPAAWTIYLEENISLYRHLPESQQQKLQNDLRVIISEKYWEGCKGFAVTEGVPVTVAAQMALLVLGIEEEYFEHVIRWSKEILWATITRLCILN